MVLGEPEGVGGSAVEDVRLAVEGQILRAGQRRVEQAFITYAWGAAMQEQAFPVQQQQCPSVDPGKHLIWRVRGKCRGTRA